MYHQAQQVSLQKLQAQPKLLFPTFKAHKVFLALQAPQVQLAQRVLLVLALLVPQVLRVLLDRKVLQVPQVLLAQVVPLAQ
jgi:hypothetical protein